MESRKPLTEEHKKKLSTNHADFFGEKNPMYGKKMSEDSRKKISASRKGKFCGEKNPFWKGGSYVYLHQQNGNIYRKKSCEKCGITNQMSFHIFGERLSIHNITKNYTEKDQKIWQTFCRSCHQKVERLLK